MHRACFAFCFHLRTLDSPHSIFHLCPLCWNCRSQELNLVNVLNAIELSAVEWLIVCLKFSKLHRNVTSADFVLPPLFWTTSFCSKLDYNMKEHPLRNTGGKMVVFSVLQDLSVAVEKERWIASSSFLFIGKLSEFSGEVLGYCVGWAEQCDPVCQVGTEFWVGQFVDAIGGSDSVLSAQTVSRVCQSPGWNVLLSRGWFTFILCTCCTLPGDNSFEFAFVK